MNNFKMLKKLYISLLITIITIILGSSAVNAVWFSGWKNGSNPLWTSREFYCVEHQDYFTVGDWNPISTWTINSDNASHSNRILANILYNGIKTGQGGYNGRGEYQWAVWKWFYENGRVNTEPVSSARYDLAFNETIKPTPYSSGNAGLSVADNQVTMEGNVGSIKINSISGKVNKVEVIWKDPTNNKEYTKNISSGKNKEAGWIEFYSDKACTKALNINDFNKGTIYVKNIKEGYDIKKINIHVTNNASGYSVTVTRWRKSTGQASQQDLISATMTEGKSTEVTIPLKVKYTYGELKIIKKGVYKEDDKAKQENITASFKLYCNTLNKWVAGDVNGNKTYVDSIDKATTYKSNSIIKRLLASYKYQLVEVSVDDRYNYYNNPIKMIAVTSDLQKGLKVTKKDSYYASSSVIVYSNRTNTVTVKDERTAGKIKIIKVDDTKKELTLPGAKFKIYCKDKGWLVRNSDGTYKYDGDVKSATEFTSNEKGEAQIECVKYGTYYVYETVAPEGYDITKQDGYENKNNKDPYSYSKDNKWVYLGEVKLNSSNNTVKYTFTNKKIVNLEGKVWVDNPDRKDNGYNSIYDGKDWTIQDKNITKDSPKKDINVSLYSNKDGKIKFIDKTTTDEKGHYEFKNLNYWELENCYVEFEYDNKKYVVVDPFVGNDVKINSKAIEEVMTKEELIDEELTGTDGKNPGRAVTYKGGSNLNKTPLTGYYNNKTYTIEDINLGIKEKHDPTFSVFENLEYIKVNMNGYSYKYQHGEDPVTFSNSVPKATTQTGEMRFSQALYPSDIKYLNEKDEGMEVYVVYSITVSNNDTTYIDDIYNEQKLYLTSLVNKYDTKRYELCTTNDIGDKYGADFANWSADKPGIAKYDIEHGVYKNGIEKPDPKKEEEGKSVTSRIQFKVQKPALIDMLEHYKNADAKDYYETSPTVATVNAYHDYLRTDNVWDEEHSAKSYDDIKKYSEKNTDNKTYFVHKSNTQEKSSSNLYINLTLGESRKIKGKVFEDEVVDNALGNGQLDKEEKNRAKGVKVDLLMPDKENLADLYYVEVEQNEQTKTKVITSDRITSTEKEQLITDADGEYTIDGVVPGYYYIRFTYGDGSQKMVDTNGKEVDIKSNEYKSTIIKNETIQKAMEATQDEAVKLADWYKHIDARYNTAIDDLDQRKNIDGYIYTRETVKDKDGKEVTKIKVTDNDGNVKEDKDIIMNINSYTPMIGISIEDDKEIKQDENGNDVIEYKNEFTGFNFGLIKQPDTKITVDKKITNVKFTNQVGTTLVSENPASKQSTYVTALDAAVDKSGSKYAKLEIEPEFIYGSNIELTYEIEIINNSAKDFVEADTDPNFGDYYKYGKSENALAKKVTVKVLEDDLDEKFNYNSVPTTTTQTTSYTTSIEPHQISIEPVITEKTESDGTKTTTQYLEMTGWESLESGQSTKTSYTVTALIANDDLDTDYRNDAKVKSLSIDTLSTLSTNSINEWKANKTVFTITPTTGENRNQVYWYIAAIALAIGVSGLILIKKKVL